MKRLHGCLAVLCFLILCLPVLAAAESVDNEEADQETYTETAATKDPYETYNRHAFALNQTLDKVIFKPVASIYHYVTPWPIRRGVTNFFSNLHEVPSFANSMLQFNFNSAATAFWRFSINSTIGVLGIVDIASKMGLHRQSQDFGLTLAHYGDTESPYLVLPVFGPSTVRDSISIPVDYYLSLYPHIYSRQLRKSLIQLNIINLRSNLLDVENVVSAVAFDRYTFERDAYLQNRHARITGEVVTLNEDDLYIDDDEFADEDTDAETEVTKKANEAKQVS